MRRLVLAHEARDPLVVPLHSEFESMGMVVAMVSLRRTLLSIPNVAAQLHGPLPGWLDAMDFAPAASACQDRNAGLVLLAQIRRAHAALNLTRACARKPEDASAVAPIVGNAPPAGATSRVHSCNPSKWVAALVRLEWGALLEDVAAHVVASEPSRAAATPHRGGRDGDAARVWHNSYCASLWTSVHAEYFAVLDDVLAKAPPCLRSNTDARAALDAHVATFVLPAPTVHTVPNFSTVPNLMALYERTDTVKPKHKSAQFMLLMITRCCTTSMHSWKNMLTRASPKDVDGAIRVLVQVLGVAVSGMHPAVNPCMRPSWRTRFLSIRMWREQSHVSQFKDMSTHAAAALREVVRLHLSAMLMENPPLMDALQRYKHPAGQLQMPQRGLPPAHFVKAMQLLLTCGRRQFSGHETAPCESLALSLQTGLQSSTHTSFRTHARRDRTSLPMPSTLAYEQNWLCGRSSIAPKGTLRTTACVMGGLLDACFRSTFVPLWVHAHSHSNRASRLDKAQLCTMHEWSESFKFCKSIHRSVFRSMLKLVLETNDADLLSPNESLTLMGIDETRVKTRAAGLVATELDVVPCPTESRATQRAEQLFLSLTAQEASMVYAFARFSALRAQLVVYDLGARTAQQQARALCARLRVVPDRSANETHMSVLQSRVPKHATYIFVCASCRRIANAVQDSKCKNAPFNELGLSASMLQLEKPPASSSMRCAKRSSASLRNSAELASVAEHARVDDLEPCAHDLDPTVADATSSKRGLSDAAKLRRDVKHSIAQSGSSCGCAPLVEINALGRVVQIFDRTLSICAMCGSLCDVLPLARYGAEIFCGRCDHELLHGKERHQSLSVRLPKRREVSCRFCGKIMPKNGSERWKTVAAPIDSGGTNATIPPPLRKATYCPVHFKPWLVAAHLSISTREIFSHLLVKARPLFGAEESKNGKTANVESLIDEAVAPASKKSTRHIRNTELTKRISRSKKQKTSV